jgi:hypothetical protein
MCVSEQKADDSRKCNSGSFATTVCQETGFSKGTAQRAAYGMR